jgi:hypothetical protein
VGWEDCRDSAFGVGRGFELAFGGGGVLITPARAAADEVGRCAVMKLFDCDFGESKGFN